MAGRIVCVCLALAVLAAPAGAQPAEEEIEMEGDPPKPPPPPPPPAAETPPADPAAPAAPVKDPKLAKKWLGAGQVLMQKGDYFTRIKRVDDAKASYENAATAFQKSIEAGEDLNTYALLAEAEDKLGKPDVAARHYRVIVKAQAGIRPDVLKKATAKFDELSMKVGILALAVTPEGTVISLAGAEIGKAPLAEPLILMPGTYTVAFQADGFQPKEAELVIEAGSESERTIELEAVKIVVHAPVKDEEPVEVPKPPKRPSKVPLYVGAGATIALVGVAAVTGILAVGRHGDYTAEGASASEREDAKSSGKTFALVSDLTLVGGLAAGGFTAYWYFAKYRSSQRKPTETRPAITRAKVDVVPWVQPAASGLTLVGVF